MKILDVSVLANVKAFAKDMIKNYDKIDILINNAAVINQPFYKSCENFEITLSTNYLGMLILLIRFFFKNLNNFVIGPFLLTHLLLPLLKKSDNARIINVSASAHFTAAVTASDFKQGNLSKFTFGQTKLAMVLFTKYLAKLTEGIYITY